MNLDVANTALLRNLDKEFKKAAKNETCFYPGCNDHPIGSHIIARSTLDLIDDTGHVLTWLPLKVSAFDMARSMIAGRPVERLYENPISVGIGDKNKITYQLFCQYHDMHVFAPIDSVFSYQPEQIVLLAYRALCAMAFSLTRAVLQVSKQYGYQHSLSTPDALARLERFQASDSVLKVRRCYEQIHDSHDYNQLGWSVYPVNLPPCIAATYSLIPVNDEDAQAIINGTYTLAAEDVVSFSFLPYPPLCNSICVISWLRGSTRGQRFMTLNRINELSEKEQQALFLRLAFEAPTPYISPVWWNALSLAEREEYKTFHNDAGRGHAQLVY